MITTMIEQNVSSEHPQGRGMRGRLQSRGHIRAGVVFLPGLDLHDLGKGGI